MSTKWLADDLFDLPSGNVNRYKRNYLRQAVCELRFPTLMSLGSRKPPVAFANSLRKEYPHVEQATELAMPIGAPADPNYHHLFRSSKMTWTVTLKINALTLETTRYSEYKELRERVLKLVAVARDVIDTDFFTRVGLRYINVVTTGEGPLDPWINRSLIGALCSGAKFKGVREHAGKLLLATDDGGCLLQHGLQAKPQGSKEDAVPDYVIDVDTFRNEVALGDLSTVLDAVHRQGFDMFDWALGHKAREFLAADRV